MAVKYQNYQPDTCECFLCQTYDPDTQEFGLVEQYTAPDGITYTTKRCTPHAGLININDLWDAIYKRGDSEQKRKNMTHAHLLAESSLAESKVNDSGETVVDFKQGIEFNWSFEGEGTARLMNIELTGIGLNVLQKSTLETKLKGLLNTSNIKLK